MLQVTNNAVYDGSPSLVAFQKAGVSSIMLIWLRDTDLDLLTSEDQVLISRVYPLKKCV